MATSFTVVLAHAGRRAAGRRSHRDILPGGRGHLRSGGRASLLVRHVVRLGVRSSNDDWSKPVCGSPQLSARW